MTTAIVVHSHIEENGAQGVEPITIGLPMARGLCADPHRLRLSDSGGGDIPLQRRVLARWPDGSIKWVLLDFQHRASAARTTYTLACGASAPAECPDPLVVDTAGGEIAIQTAGARFTIDKSAFPFKEVLLNGRDVLARDRCGLDVEDAGGRKFALGVDEAVVEDAGPLRGVVRVAGSLIGDARERLEFEARLHFFAGLPAVRVALTLKNPRRASHRGGFWELGDAGSVLLRDVSFRLALRTDAPSTAWCSPEAGVPLQSTSGRVEVYQDSSGGDNWMSPVHLNRENRVPNSFRGYALRIGSGEGRGDRATPQVAIAADGMALSLAMPEFWQNFPKAMEADAGSVVLRLWPAQYADAHELQGGEQKTHVFVVEFTTAAAGVGSTGWHRRPSVAAAAPAWYGASGAIPFLGVGSDDLFPVHRGLVEAAIDGPDCFERKREVVDEYGWRNFGDLYADHEAVFHREPTTFVSHYNNQYDAIRGFGLQFMRTGDPRWWRAMEQLAAHVIDIDIYHAVDDKAAYNGGLFWHTCHHLAAGRSTHRSYPKAPGTDGGGPGNEHNYSGGLTLHYFLTGNRPSLDTVVGLARWVGNMDDGRETPLALLTSAPTGLASSTDTPGYHGPGRGAAYSIDALLDGYRLTGNRPFLDTAEGLIRRCIHPTDDVGARDLLDIEPKWSYTLFLQTLGRYLEFKHEIGELNAMYAYARESLLQYARWMVDHESPYLDTPGRLEFPNETWVAQEARKSEAFDFAARHSTGEERQRFLDKAASFWRYGIETLAAMPTRTLTRPMVLMLGHGLLRSHMVRHPDDRSPAADCPPPALPPARPFVTQKQRVKQRLMLAGAGAFAAMSLLIVEIVSRLWR